MQPVIRVENLSKEYQLGTVNHGTLTHDLQSWWARLRGKEDPNSLLSHHPSTAPAHPSSLVPHQDSNPHFLALNDVSFDIQQGDLVGIIGRNGAGKSTLLKILSQVTSPSAGTVKIKGRVASLLEVGTGFHPELTGRENVFLNGAILGMSKSEIQRKFDEIVAFAEIEKFIDTPVKRYSSGMYVRLAFAVAAHLEPEILIVDEVLAVGDAQFQKKCLGKMQDVGSEGRTVLFVSHNMAAIQALCKTGILLNAGVMSYLGNMSDTIHYYNKLLMGEVKSELEVKPGVKILGIKVISNANGQITANSSLDVSIQLITSHALPNCYLNLVIEDSEGRTIIHSRTDLFDVYPTLELGKHDIVVHFGRISIRSGIYSLWFRLYCNTGNIYELVDSDRVMLEVDGPQVGGFLDVPCSWMLDGNRI